ncbi:MAG: helix-turn-helix domain-containing protein [Gemmatimonadota bacterium]|nr:MAG: helix-turn-helix domain-containing protein [Gemmatimonadota bacterium]
MARKSVLQARLGQIVEVVFGGNQKAAATAAGVPAPTLHRILKGEIANPGVGSLERFARAYRVPVSWLLGETDADVHTARVPATWWWLLESYYGHRVAVHMRHFSGDVAAKVAEATHQQGIALVARLLIASGIDPERAPSRWVERAAAEFQLGLERLSAVAEVWLRLKTSERRQLIADLSREVG